MKKSYLLTLALLAVGASAQQAGDKSYLGIFAETKVMRFAGRPMPKMPQLPAGVQLPPQARAAMKAMMGSPSRSLTVRLWSPTIAPDSATAVLMPPSGLGQGDKLDLDLYRPKPAEGTGGGPAGPGSTTHNNMNITIKVYWGSSDTVKAGQPKVFDFSTMTMEQKMEMGKHMKPPSMGFGMRPGGGGPGGAGGGGDYFYKDGWTTGYWPTSEEPGDISDSAALPGTYNLNTNFAGNVTIDDPSNVDFLAPIEMTSPDLSVKPNLESSLPFQWSAIPNAIGEFATMFGSYKDGNNLTLIMWSSSEVYVEQMMADMGFLQMSEVKDNVDKTVFMPGSATAATVPAGIFKDCDFVMFNMVGYGPGTAKDDVTPVPRIQTKTTLNILFPGKKNMGGGARGGGDEDGG